MKNWPFDEIWVVDFEYKADPGERPVPHCMVAVECYSQRRISLTWEQLKSLTKPPFGMGPRVLVVAFYAPAEFSCFLELGWPCPTHILDLYVELKWLKSGVEDGQPRSLIGAMQHFRLDEHIPEEKECWRQLAMRGAPFTQAEMDGLLHYCYQDVAATNLLLERMSKVIDLPRSLLRGQYCWSVAVMERDGIPIDVPALTRLRERWEDIRLRLVEATDDHRLYEGTTFKYDRFEQFLKRHGIAWPRLETGKLCLDDKTFRKQSKIHPQLISPYYELRATMGKMKLNKLAVGSDGRNRTMISPFQSKTSRNQPSNSKFIFGPSTWIRGLIKPPPGRALAYIDWSQQELGIAASLSKDKSMMAAYRSGDPYLTFARMAGAVPEDATKQSHPVERSRYKQCMLAVQYGMGPHSLAQTTGLHLIEAASLLQAHKDAFPHFWAWMKRVEIQAFATGKLISRFGWQVRVTPESRPASVMNFPVQCNGAEMLRLAIMRMHQRGIQVAAPIHDAVLIEAPSDDIDQAASAAQECMVWASEQVLEGFRLESDAKIIRYPDRYMDEDRGLEMWNRIMGLADLPLHISN